MDEGKDGTVVRKREEEIDERVEGVRRRQRWKNLRCRKEGGWGKEIFTPQFPLPPPLPPPVYSLSLPTFCLWIEGFFLLF